VQAVVPTDASRGLMAGDVAAGDIAIVLATAALLTAVFAPPAGFLDRTRSA